MQVVVIIQDGRYVRFVSDTNLTDIRLVKKQYKYFSRPIVGYLECEKRWQIRTDDLQWMKGQ